MRRLLLVCLLFSLTSFVSAASTLKEARTHWLRGHYEEAIEGFQELAKEGKEGKTRAAACIGISRAQESLGEYDKALAALEPGLKEDPKNADLLARQAELYFLRGKWDDADKSVKASLAENKDHLLARWVEAQLLRDRGEVEKADQACRWFLRHYNERSGTDKEITAPEELVIVGNAAAEYARWHGLSDQFDTILNDLYGDAAKSDKYFWPAEVAAGNLLLEKYNRPDALKAFDKALEIDGTCPDALVGKGRSAFQRFEFKDAESFAERALKTNPKHPEALRLIADVHLTGGDVAGALKELETARKVNPRDEATLGRIAVCLQLNNKKADLDKLTAEVKGFDSKPAGFYYEMGQAMEARRRYGEAEKLYREAMVQRPNLPGPAANLGLLLMRMGEEKEGGELLEKAFKADSFNVRVSNMRKVVRHLEGYKTHETEHFAIRHDPKTDGILARYLGEMLEDTYKELAGKFDHKPKGPILIEVFNNHEMFSGRTVALPDLHTIGACTGRIITMVSPSGKGTRPFNWGRVMRHELVHIFNLEQTNFLVPHWVTEGLAVENEGFPRPQPWNAMLKKRVAADKLLNLETIDLGFMRPRDPEEWQLAYAQAQLYMRYIVKTYKQEAVGKLLAAFGEGLNVDAALKKACDGVDRAAFEKGYKEYLKTVVAEIGGSKSEEKRPIAEVKADYDKNPNDPDIGAEYAEAMLSRDRAEARKLAQAVLSKKAGHPRASLVLARLAGLGGDKDEQLRLLEAALDRGNPDVRVLRELAKLYYDAQKWDKANEVMELGRKAEPFEIFWAEQLQRVYAQTGEKKKLIAVLKELVLADADEIDRRKRLARLLDEAADYPGAEQAARQVLEINVKDKDARDILLKALEKQDKKADAERLRKLLDG
jgi:tetratricopeptide (TPR) repeat protein